MNRRQFAAAMIAAPVIAASSVVAGQAERKTIGRIASNPGDQGYRRYKAIAPAGGINVRLNGELQRYVFAADDRLGFVSRYICNAEDRMYVAGDGLRTETLYGHVTYEHMDGRQIT